MNLHDLITNEERRQHEFPVCAERIFMGHAGVTALPRVAADALRAFADGGSKDYQEAPWAMAKIREARGAAAELLGCTREEIALLGPTAMGLNLVATGLPWEPGDEVVFYQDDYPANVYPWAMLEPRGVKPVRVQPPHPGAITWEVVEAALSDRTRLVSLATCNYLSGYRIDVDRIGRELNARGILFCLDAIQTLGAFPISVEHVDFLSADSHKWMLGCCGAGIFYVKRERMELLQPPLVGALNVRGWERFVAQEEPEFLQTGRRYEFGTMNAPGILGMGAALRLLLDLGIDNVAERLLHIRRVLLEGLRAQGYRLYIEECDRDSDTTDLNRTSIVSVTHPDRDMPELTKRLADANVTVSLRQNRAEEWFVRFSPHFYNTEAEIEQVLAVTD
jgi:selenocysteine lyase/cysteine desulfurase